MAAPTEKTAKLVWLSSRTGRWGRTHWRYSEESPPRSNRRARLRRGLLYCLEPLPDRPEMLAFLNRDYEPLHPGVDLGHMVNVVERRHVDLGVLRCANGRWYLYDGGCAPWLSQRLAREYQERIAWAFKERVKPCTRAALRLHTFNPRPKLRLLQCGR
jgi:hypothetical protein